MEHGKSQIFPKGRASFNTKNIGQLLLSRRSVVIGENNLRFLEINPMARMGTETMEGVKDSLIVSLIYFSK